MKYEIRGIRVWSVVRIIFPVSLLFGAITGLAIVILLAVAGLVVGTFNVGVQREIFSLLGIFSGLLGLVLVPIGVLVLAILHTAAVAISVGLYNMVARSRGGVHYECECCPSLTVEPVEAAEPVDSEELRERRVAGEVLES